LKDTRARRLFRRASSDPFFPYTFLGRNFRALALDARWKKLPARLRCSRFQQIIQQRTAFFLEVRMWQSKKAAVLSRSSRPLPSRDDSDISYCTNCGGCCEIASGFPDFPEETELPVAWKTLFGEGLGEGHRFCPFLFEVERSGKSLCAIHPWRSFPCRAFEEEECTFLKQDGYVETVKNSRDLPAPVKSLFRRLRRKRRP
jgi:hypothetical protein